LFACLRATTLIKLEMLYPENMWVLSSRFLMTFYKIFDGIYSFRRNFFTGARQKFCPQPRSQSFNNFWQIAYSIKISVKMLFWRDDVSSKISLKSYWRGVSLLKWTVKKNFDGLSVRQKLFVNFFDGCVKIAILTKYFLTDILSVKISVRKATFRQKISFFLSKNQLFSVDPRWKFLSRCFSRLSYTGYSSMYSMSSGCSDLLAPSSSSLSVKDTDKTPYFLSTHFNSSSNTSSPLPWSTPFFFFFFFFDQMINSF